MSKSLRIVCISDTHEQHDEISLPDGDILIHAGDFTWAGELKAVRLFNEWIFHQPHQYKIIIAGNHDFTIQSRKCSVGNYCEDSGVEIEGIKFWGSPFTPTFGNWAFMEDRDKIGKHWEKIPQDTDVLITHGPPFGILDKTPMHESVGCKRLRDHVRMIKPKLHIFGHIHHSYGKIERDETLFINASICNEDYQAVNAPVVVDLTSPL